MSDKPEALKHAEFCDGNVLYHPAAAELRRLHAECERLRAYAAALQDVVDSIYVYANDTLSGRTDGPDDREWQRAGVVEIRNRALAFSTVQTAVDARAAIDAARKEQA